MIIPAGRRTIVLAVGIAAIGVGIFAAAYYHHLGLTLSHYDARGHLVVARRIMDSITPGWQQIGAVWLPLPHLLNAIPVQADGFYRTGASAVVISIAAFALAASATAWIVVTLTGSRVSGVLAAAVFALNPNILYLQSTPMTEPLLLGLIVLATALLVEGIRPRTLADAAPPHASIIGWTFALACLTRYEAWPVTATALGAALWAGRRQGLAWRESLRRVSGISVYPAGAVIGFVVFSRIVSGSWFVGSEFFVPENAARGLPLAAAGQVAWALRTLSGYGLTVAAAGGVGLALVQAATRRDRSALVIPLALTAAAALPFVAFLEGHPFRVRYGIPLIAAEGIAVGLGVGLIEKGRAVAALAAIAIIGLELRPLDATAAMAIEAQWDRPNVVKRQPIGDYLQSHYSGETVMASMGSLGHYMQELSQRGFRVSDFLHEGNGDIWLNALDNPRPYAGWILIEEQAEGGDMLAGLARANPRFLEGFSRVAEGAGIALYRRDLPVASATTLP